MTIKIKRQRDFATGLVFVFFGMVFAWAAGRWPLGGWDTPGPGFFAILFSVPLVTLGGAVLFTSLTIESVAGDPIGAIEWHVPLLLLSLAGLGAVLPHGGGVPCIFAVALLWRVAAAPQAFVRGKVGLRARLHRLKPMGVNTLAYALALTLGAWLMLCFTRYGA